MRYFGDCSPNLWAYRPIDSIPQKAIIDTNVLLDAILISDGIGTAALSGLSQRKIALYTTRKSISEARKTLCATRDYPTNITKLLDIFVQQSGIAVHDDDRRMLGIKDHDSHLAAAAVDLSAFVVTEDMPLLYDLDRSRIHGRSLRETVLACVAPNQPHQNLMIFGCGSGADGHVFMKFMPHEDLCKKADRSWFLLDSPGFMSISYNGNMRSFEINWEAGGQLILPIELSSEEQYALYFNYSVGKRTNAQVRVRSVGSQIEHLASGVLAPLQQRPNGKITLMNSREKNVGWKGTLQNVTFGPYILNKKVWRASHALVGVAPPTLTADLTQIASLLTEIKGDHVRRPLWQQVVQMLNVCIPGFYPGRGRAERPDEWFD